MARPALLAGEWKGMGDGPGEKSYDFERPLFFSLPPLLVRSENQYVLDREEYVEIRFGR